MLAASQQLLLVFLFLGAMTLRTRAVLAEQASLDLTLSLSLSLTLTLTLTLSLSPTLSLSLTLTLTPTPTPTLTLSLARWRAAPHGAAAKRGGVRGRRDRRCRR